ncbi:MAG: hypothetical protein ACOYM2_19900 [Rectinemataceae bacterium]
MPVVTYSEARKTLAAEFPDAERVCIARVGMLEVHDGILVLPWRMALERYFS